MPAWQYAQTSDGAADAQIVWEAITVGMAHRLFRVVRDCFWSLPGLLLGVATAPQTPRYIVPSIVRDHRLVSLAWCPGCHVTVRRTR